MDLLADIRYALRLLVTCCLPLSPPPPALSRRSAPRASLRWRCCAIN